MQIKTLFFVESVDAELQTSGLHKYFMYHTMIHFIAKNKHIFFSDINYNPYIHQLAVLKQIRLKQRSQPHTTKQNACLCLLLLYVFVYEPK